MKIKKVLNGLLVGLAAVGFCLPEPLFAEAKEKEKPPRPAAVDVALRDGGVLVGQVVSPQGKGVADTQVTVRHLDKNLTTTKSGQEGYFAVKGLRGGVYQLVADEGQGVYRFWSPGTAPPNAQEGAVLVAGKPIVRGQPNGGAHWKTWLTNPLVIAGVVATAVAVPVAIHNSNRRQPASP
jgi:hypothetical protein